jgi:hypothetical protein
VTLGADLTIDNIEFESCLNMVDFLYSWLTEKNDNSVDKRLALTYRMIKATVKKHSRLTDHQDQKSID